MAIAGYMFLMVAGAGVMLCILTSVMHLIVAQNEVAYGRLSGHFIVCGFSRVGKAVALTLQEQSAALVVRDKDAEALAEAEELDMVWVRGDSAQDENLLAAYVREATCPR